MVVQLGGAPHEDLDEEAASEVLDVEKIAADSPAAGGTDGKNDLITFIFFKSS